MNNDKKQKIDFSKLIRSLWGYRKRFLKVWIWTFILSCIWILPQPRYYSTEVSIAPESSEAGAAGGLASLAANFGLDIGGNSSDAIYPQLYPDLMSSTDFLVGLLDIHVTTLEGDVSTDYYTYLREYQKKNYLTYPFIWVKNRIKDLIKKKDPEIAGKGGKRFDPFRLSKTTTDIIKTVQDNVDCLYSRTTNVVTITVTDQDPLVSAVLADSIKAHLQAFITEYRTKKARIDYEYYKQLTHDAKTEYDIACRDYARYADAHQNALIQAVRTKLTDMEYEMQMKHEIYSAMTTREQAALAELQARTPVFTTLMNATVPVKPKGPKRMIFVAAMLFLATLGTIVYIYRSELKEWF